MRHCCYGCCSFWWWWCGRPQLAPPWQHLAPPVAPGAPGKPVSRVLASSLPGGDRLALRPVQYAFVISKIGVARQKAGQVQEPHTTSSVSRRKTTMAARRVVQSAGLHTTRRLSPLPLDALQSLSVTTVQLYDNNTPAVDRIYSTVNLVVCRVGRVFRLCLYYR